MEAHGKRINRMAGKNKRYVYVVTKDFDTIIAILTSRKEAIEVVNELGHIGYLNIRQYELGEIEKEYLREITAKRIK